MLVLAACLKQTNPSDVVGILNPSDVEAVCDGFVGMYFDSAGHIAMEEVLAVSTTMLTMHRVLNPELWTKDATTDRSGLE